MDFVTLNINALLIFRIVENCSPNDMIFLKCYLASLPIAKLNSARDRWWVWSCGRMAPTGNNESTCRETCPSVTFSITDLTRTVLGLNMTPRWEAGDWLYTLSHGSAVISDARSSQAKVLCTQTTQKVHTNKVPWLLSQCYGAFCSEMENVKHKP